MSPSDVDKLIVGDLRSSTHEQAIESLSFLLGTSYRVVGTNVYLIGGKPVKAVNVYPSFGLQPQQITGALREGAATLGDSVVVETEQNRAAQIQTVLESFRDRKQLNLEIILLDVQTNLVTAGNQWLETFRLGLGYQSTPAAIVEPAAGVVADINAVLKLVNDSSGVSLKLHEYLSVLSGSSSEFQSGQVLEDVQYVTVGQTSGQVQSVITRRTVGITLNVGAVACGTNWMVDFTLQNSAVVSSSEFTTRFSGQRMCNEGEGYFMLGNFTADQNQGSRDSVPGLKSVPGLGKLFRKSSETANGRTFYLLARVVPGGTVSPAFEPKRSPYQFDESLGHAHTFN